MVILNPLISNILGEDIEKRPWMGACRRVVVESWKIGVHGKRKKVPGLIYPAPFSCNNGS